MPYPCYNFERDNMYVGVYNPSYKRGKISCNLDRELKEVWCNSYGRMMCIQGFWDTHSFNIPLEYNKPFKIFVSPLEGLVGDSPNPMVDRLNLFQQHSCKYMETTEFYLTDYGYCNVMSLEEILKKIGERNGNE